MIERLKMIVSIYGHFKFLFFPRWHISKANAIWRNTPWYLHEICVWKTVILNFRQQTVRRVLCDVNWSLTAEQTGQQLAWNTEDFDIVLQSFYYDECTQRFGRQREPKNDSVCATVFIWSIDYLSNLRWVIYKPDGWVIYKGGPVWAMYRPSPGWVIYKPSSAWVMYRPDEGSCTYKSLFGLCRLSKRCIYKS